MAVAVSSQLQQWADSVLQLTGNPVNPTNEDTLYRWARSESGSNPLRWNNPLNTTEPWTGAQAVNSAGVKRYPDLNTGARATAATLTNGYYPDILSSLQNSIPTSQWSSAARSQVTKWGTNLAFLGGTLGSGPAFSSSSPTSGSSFVYGANPGQIGYTGRGQQNPGAVDSGGVSNPFDALGNAISGAGVNIGQGVGSAIGSAEQSAMKSLIAAFEIAAGAALILLGGVILVVLVTRGAAPAAARAATLATPAGRAASVVGGAVQRPKRGKPSRSLSPQAQNAVSEARAGRGSRLSPEVKSELRGRAA